MARELNPCAKTVGLDNPYEVWQTRDGRWTWKVLKKYQSPTNEKKNKLARWFVAVRSPYTYNSWEMGDEYVLNITEMGSYKRAIVSIDFE
ncbi:MAG: hypothetical protein HOA75_14495 [Deltaproteobacteria bacterium]|nr:hypothetical protein [Deltaproteobacteria bacterium]